MQCANACGFISRNVQMRVVLLASHAFPGSLGRLNFEARKIDRRAVEKKTKQTQRRVMHHVSVG
jgi:hypothetical protein